MTVPSRSTSLQAYSMLVYRKALHPEFFGIEGRSHLSHDGMDFADVDCQRKTFDNLSSFHANVEVFDTQHLVSHTTRYRLPFMKDCTAL